MLNIYYKLYLHYVIELFLHVQIIAPKQFYIIRIIIVVIYELTVITSIVLFYGTYIISSSFNCSFEHDSCRVETCHLLLRCRHILKQKLNIPNYRSTHCRWTGCFPKITKIIQITNT